MSLTKLLAVTAITLGSVAAQTSSVEISRNGGFETGNFSGWQLFPSEAGNITIVSPGSGSKFAGYINNKKIASASLIKNNNIGIGFVKPNDTVTIKFEARGMTAVGGVAFAEFFSEKKGGGTSKAEILGGRPLPLDADPNKWTTFTFTATTGPDVSGGVTLQLTGTTGGATGSIAQIYYDNISITVSRNGTKGSYTPFGTACKGTTGTPTLSSNAAPYFGESFQLELSNLRANTPVIFFIGASKTTWGALMLPFDLGALGMTGCKLYASGETALVVAADGSGKATLPLPMNIPGLIGATFHNQGFAVDAGANSANLVASNGATGVIGLR